MDADEFGRELIIAEEAVRDEGESVAVDRSEVVPIQREDFTATVGFVFHEPGTSMPIDGPGTLVNATLIAETSDFRVTLDVDGREVVADTFEGLMTHSAALERISAYQRNSDDNYVFVASGYEFQDAVNVAIVPDDSLTVRLQRAEIDVVR